MLEMGVEFDRISASRYAGELRKAVRPDEPHKLLDLLLVGAFIEARSCERFAKLAPQMPPQLGRFYCGLLASESRHFEHYIALAQQATGISAAALSSRLEELRNLEAALITQPDTEFRFHSGPPP
jgi:tRNA-(ms[2]io[6]A)-hydroxylase